MSRSPTRYPAKRLFGALKCAHPLLTQGAVQTACRSALPSNHSAFHLRRTLSARRAPVSVRSPPSSLGPRCQQARLLFGYAVCIQRNKTSMSTPFCVYTCGNRYTYTQKCPCSLSVCPVHLSVSASPDTCMYVFMCVCIYIYIYISDFIRVSKRIIRVYFYIYIYIYIYIISADPASALRSCVTASVFGLAYFTRISLHEFTSFLACSHGFFWW